MLHCNLSFTWNQHKNIIICISLDTSLTSNSLVSKNEQLDIQFKMICFWKTLQIPWILDLFVVAARQPNL